MLSDNNSVINKNIVGRGRKSQIWLNEQAVIYGWGPTNFHNNFVDLCSEYGIKRRWAAERLADQILQIINMDLNK